MKRWMATLFAGSLIFFGVVFLGSRVISPAWAQLPGGAAPAESVSTHGYVIANQPVKGSSIPAHLVFVLTRDDRVVSNVLWNRNGSLLKSCVSRATREQETDVSNPRF